MGKSLASWKSYCAHKILADRPRARRGTFAGTGILYHSAVAGASGRVFHSRALQRIYIDLSQRVVSPSCVDAAGQRPSPHPRLVALASPPPSPPAGEGRGPGGGVRGIPPRQRSTNTIEGHHLAENPPKNLCALGVFAVKFEKLYVSLARAGNAIPVWQRGLAHNRRSWYNHCCDVLFCHGRNRAGGDGDFAFARIRVIGEWPRIVADFCHQPVSREFFPAGGWVFQHLADSEWPAPVCNTKTRGDMTWTRSG